MFPASELHVGIFAFKEGAAIHERLIVQPAHTPFSLARSINFLNVLIEKKEPYMTSRNALKERRDMPLTAISDIPRESVKEITGALNALLADVFALYLKTKNFHWHMSGPHFRDYHLLLDEHGDQIFAITDDIAERVRKIGGKTIHSIGEIADLQRVADNDADYVTPQDMLSELLEDNKALVFSMRAAHDLCAQAGDVATTSLLETWIDQAQRRAWFLFEAVRAPQIG